MIRGAFILAVGFSLGYVKGLSDADKVVAGLKALGEIIKEAAVDVNANSDIIDGTEAEPDKGNNEPISAELPSTDDEPIEGEQLS